MANPRYHRLQELIIDSYYLNAPVEIEKGALLLDTQTKSVLLQLKLTILRDAPKDISSVLLLVKGFDDTGTGIDGLDPKQCIFRDVYLLKDKSFGEKTPIILDSRIRRVQVEITRVTLTSGVTWVPNGESIRPEKQKSIRALSPELAEQLDREINQVGHAKELVLFMPEQRDRYWLCACGRPNEVDARSCARCGLSKAVAFSLTEETLRGKLEDFKEKTRLEAERVKAENELALFRQIENNRKLKEENDRKKAENKARTNKLIKIVAVIGSIAAVLAVFFFAVLPAIKYSQAENDLEEKNYELALARFDALDDYKNSEIMMFEVKFQQAKDFFMNKDYGAASRIFSEINGYKESSSLLNEAIYQQAADLLSKKEFNEAKALFTNLGDYLDAAEMAKEVEFQKASGLLSSKKYDEAKQLFVNLGEYKTSSELVMESDYQKASDLLSSDQFDDALTVFESISGYKDAGELIKESKYKLALSDYQAKNYTRAVEAFLELIGYEKADQYVSNFYALGTKYLTDKNYDESIKVFEVLNEYSNAKELLTEAKYQKGIVLLSDEKFSLAKDIFSTLGSYKDSVNFLAEAKYELGKQYLGDGKFTQAAEIFDSLGVYKDSRKLLSYALVDRSDPKSIIEMVNKAIESRDIGLLASFVSEEGVLYTNFYEGGLDVSKEDFLKDLQDRLPFTPICQGVTEEEGILEVWYLNWNQPWKMTEMCYSGCWQLDPPWTSPYAGFGFRLVDGKYQLKAMILKDPSSFYALLSGENYKPLISCTLYPTCKGAPQTRLAVGMRAEICPTLADPVNVRQTPGMSGERITGLYPNTAVKIISGPTCAGNSWTWWQIEYQNGRTGWITEGGDDKDKYYLCPIY